MQLTLKVHKENADVYEVKTNLMVIVAWERRFKRRASELAAGIGMEDLAFMAYEASRLNNIVVPASLDEFIKTVSQIEVEANVVNPTQAGQPAETSPSF